MPKVSRLQKTYFSHRVFPSFQFFHIFTKAENLSFEERLSVDKGPWKSSKTAATVLTLLFMHMTEQTTRPGSQGRRYPGCIWDATTSNFL